MKLAVSNIAWPAEHDAEIYKFLSEHNFQGLEIAPTRIFPDAPYAKLKQAEIFARELREQYGLEIASVQSIWHGVGESVFGTAAERAKLIGYTRKAIDFARAAGCANLVFGCPRNRAVPEGLADYMPAAVDFFGAIGEYAATCGACVAIEPNPPIYSTNFINTHAEAFALCRAVNSPGIKINADLGALIYNGEGIAILAENIGLVNHVHVSEPYLAPIEWRELHGELKNLGYGKYISAEMARLDDMALLKDILVYVEDCVAQ